MTSSTRARSALAFLCLSLAACGGDDGGGSGPTRLYLALLDSELTVQLVEQEPGPY